MNVQACAGPSDDLAWLLSLGLSTNKLSELLRDDERHYPSGALLRAVIAGKRKVTPKLAAWLKTRRAEIEEKLGAGMVIAVDTWRPTPKQVVFAVTERDDANPLFTASLGIPKEWLRTCRMCSKPFISPWRNQTVCKDPACRETLRQEWSGVSHRP